MRAVGQVEWQKHVPSLFVWRFCSHVVRSVLKMTLDEHGDGRWNWSEKRDSASQVRTDVPSMTRESMTMEARVAGVSM